MTCLFGLMLFATVGAAIPSIDIPALMAGPITYLADHSNPSGLIMSSVVFSATEMAWADGNENMGGFRNYLYIIPVSHISEFAELKTNPVTDADYVTLDGSHTLVALKYWKKVYATPGTIKCTPASQGEIDGQSFHPAGEFFFPGTGDDVNAFARIVNNGNFIIILVEENGKRVQIGYEGHPARIKPSVDLGQKPADLKGFKFEFQSDDKVAIRRYNGTIVLSEAETEPAIS